MCLKLAHFFLTQPYISRFQKSRYPQIIIQVLSPDMDGEKTHLHPFLVVRDSSRDFTWCQQKSPMSQRWVYGRYIYIYSLWFVNKESQQLTVAAMVFTQQLRQFPGKTTSLEDNFPVDFSSTAKTKCPVVNIRWGFQLIGLAIQMVYYILIKKKHIIYSQL